MLNFDEQLFLALNRIFSGDGATLFFTWITHLGDGLVLAILILPALYFADRKTFKRHAVTMVVAIALSGGVVNLMKIAVDRPRPPEHFGENNIPVHTPAGIPRDRSFPSGHTQTAFGAGTYLTCLYPKFSPLFLGLAAAVGLSRVAIGVHFPIDVLVGGLFGALFSVLGYLWRRKRSS